jgi:hypothetical protein
MQCIIIIKEFIKVIIAVTYTDDLLLYQRTTSNDNTLLIEQVIWMLSLLS